MDKPSLKQRNHWVPLLIALVLLLSAGLRTYHVDNQSLSRDEGVSAQTTKLAVADIVKTARESFYPPGYEIVLSGWQALAGGNEFALRLFSGLSGVLTVALIYRLGRQLFNRSTGLMAAIAVTVSPLQVYAGQDATRSAWLGLLSAASLVLTQTLLSLLGTAPDKSKNIHQVVSVVAGTAVINAIGLYTHQPLFLLLLLTETLVFLLWITKRSKKGYGLIAWVGLLVATLLLFAPWLPTVIDQITSQDILAADYPSWLQDLAYGFTLPVDRAQDGLVPLVLLATLGLFPPVRPANDPHSLGFIERVGWVIAWLVVPLILLAWAGNTQQRLLELFVPANLTLMLLAARGIWLSLELASPMPELGRDRNRLVHVIVISMIALALLPIFHALQYHYAASYAHDDYRSIASHIVSEAEPQAIVILETPDQYDVFTYYYPDEDGIFLMPNKDINGTLKPLIEKYRRIYAVLWNVEAQDPDHEVEKILEANALVAGTDQYGSTRLVSYAITGTEATEPQASIDARFGESIVLEGFALSANTLAPGEGLGVTLFWHTKAPLGERYKVFVHIDGPGGTPTTQHDGEPANWAAPTDSWIPGETVVDQHRLLMPDAPSGTYQVMIGLYDQAGTRLSISVNGESIGDRLFLTNIITP
ncbi:MAG: glycosyltransferase family 39 protein [Anaerolineae bacterium]|nr:glycosyltransferase family 39 protein [Anaerolineae bacterium]